MKKNFEGRNGKTYSTELLQTILSARSLSVNVFGVPTPKFINFQQKKTGVRNKSSCSNFTRRTC